MNKRGNGNDIDRLLYEAKSWLTPHERYAFFVRLWDMLTDDQQEDFMESAGGGELRMDEGKPN